MARGLAHGPSLGVDWLRSLEGHLARAAIAQRLFGDRGDDPVLGAYRIVRRIGAGAAGVVFEARHTQSGHRVALKVLKDWNAGAVQRLKNEFRALSDVHHPNLVQLHELCLDTEAPFLAMELVEGSSLARFVRMDAPGSEQRLLQATSQLIDAISTLHAAGVLHRDLKPSNLRVDAGGRLVVLDFGLARALTEASAERAGAESGTLRYMAPERLHDGTSSEASDWFSVGILLTELLPFVMEATDRQARDGSLDVRLHALVQLCRRLISVDPPERPNAAQLRAFCGLPELPVAHTVLRSSAPDGAFGGRTRELAKLRAAFHGAPGAGPAIVHVTGPAGIGKTALVGHFLRELEQVTPHLTVLTSRCHELESIPHNALDGIVEQLARELPAFREQCTPLPSTAGAAALARLFPALAAPLGEPACASFGRETEDAQHARELGFGALRTLLQRLSSTRRLVLYMDDLQWGDGDSALALRALFGRPGLAQLVIIASYRCEATGPARAAQALIELAEPSGAQTYSLPLEPLSDAESMQLAATLARGSLDPSALRAFSIEAAGSPLFLRMLVRHRGRLGTDEPSGAITLPQLLLLALAQLPSECQFVLQLSALAARPLAAHVLMAAARADMSSVAWPEHLHRLQRLGWLRSVPLPSGQGLECYHDRVRETVARSVADERRPRCHARLADAAAQSAQPDLEFLAIQNQEAGRLALAADYAERAGDRAARGFALEHAMGLYAHALSCHGGVRSVTLVAKLAEATAGAGRCMDAVPLFLECAERGGEGLPAVRLRVRAAEMLLRSGLNEDSARVFKPLLRGLGLRFHRSLHTTLGSVLINALRLRLRRVDIAAPRAIPSEFERQRIDVCLDLGYRLSVTDPLPGCSLLLRGALLAFAHGTDAQFARALACCATVFASLGLGSSNHQDTLLQQAWTLADRIDDSGVRAWIRYFRAFIAYTRAEFQRSADELAAAQQLVHAHPTADALWFLLECESGACGILAVMASVPELERRSNVALRRAQETGNTWQSAVVSCGRAVVLLARDEPDAAEAELDEILRSWPASASYHIPLMAAWAKAGVLLYRGDALAAWQLLRRYDVRHRSAGYTRVQPWITIRALGDAQLALGAMAHDPKRFMRFVERSIKTLEAQPTRYATFGCTLLKASVAQLRGQRALAAELFRITAEHAAAQGLHDSATCARVRCSQMLAADETAIADSDAAWFASQGVRKPADWIRLVAPVERSGLLSGRL